MQHHEFRNTHTCIFTIPVLMLNIYILPFCECTKDDKYFYVIFMLQGLFVERYDKYIR